MSLFAGLLARSISYQDVWGSGGDVGIRADREAQAIRLAAVYAATRLLSDGLASLPLHEYDEGQDGRRTPVAQTSALISDPSEFGSCYDWKFQSVSSLAVRGNLYGLPTGFDRLGRITRAEWLHPDDVALDGEDNVLAWRGQRPRWTVDGRPVEQLVHVRNFVLPGRVLGLSPIGAFKSVIETGLQALVFGRDWFRNGAHPSAILESDQKIDSTAAGIIKDRFKEAAAGRDVVAMGMGARYRAISVPANESQFLETIKATATTVAGIFGVPAEDIGGETGGSLTYNTDETRATRFVRFSLRPYMARIEEALSTLLPPRRVVRFNADAVLRAETLPRYQAHHYALTDGWVNRDEVRAIENLPPLPDGEGQQYQPMAGPTPPPREGPMT